MTYVAFEMSESVRQRLIAEHRFYVEQAHKRLLSQFGDEQIKAEADAAAEAYLDRSNYRFNPDFHDPADFLQWADEARCELYQMLVQMHGDIHLSVTAGMFHQWEKNLKDWIVGQIQHWHQGPNRTPQVNSSVGQMSCVDDTLWKCNFTSIESFLLSACFDIKKLNGYSQLDAMRLVVNVFKHGDGESFTELKIRYPEFIVDPLSEIGLSTPSLFDCRNYRHLRVFDLHLDKFSEAIIEFWEAVPSEIYQEEFRGGTPLPKKIEVAFIKDAILVHVEKHGSIQCAEARELGNFEEKQVSEALKQLQRDKLLVCRGAMWHLKD